MFNSYEESNSDVEVISDNGTDRDTPNAQESANDWAVPTDRGAPTGGVNPTDGDNSTDGSRDYDLYHGDSLPAPWVIAVREGGSPRIIDESLLDNENPPPPPPASESRGTQSENDMPNTYETPYPRHLASLLSNAGRLRQARELSVAADIDTLIQTTEDSIISRIIAQTGAQRAQREDAPSEPSQESVVISSASEESNQSLPEANVRDNSDTVEEPPAKVRKISSPLKAGSPARNLNKSDETDGETCPICLDTWGNSGDHRLVALKCGHLFGAECVERWLKAQPSTNRSCPTCKTKASFRDLRCIYARKLIAADNSEIVRLQKQVEVLQAEKSRTELKLQSAKMTQRTLVEQIEDLKRIIAKSHSHSQSQSQSHAPKPEEPRSYRFALEKNLEICRDGACRVMAYNCRTYDLYVSQKSTNSLFPGYGVRKVSLVDYTLGQFIHLHPKPIRDVKYSQPNDLLLSVSLDKTARVIERGIANICVHSDFPLWSCAWDHQQTYEFYVGGVGGQINHYDIRYPGTALSHATANMDMSPVVSLASTEFGLLSCQLNSCRLWEVDDGRFVSKLFPVSGSFMSMCYDAVTRKALVSMRPRSAERSKLTVCTLNPTPQGGAYIEVDNFINGSARTSVMSRATFCKADTSTWVAAHSESDATLYLHGMDGTRTISLPASEPALDVCSVQINSLSLLAALSESRLRIYKAVSC